MLAKERQRYIQKLLQKNGAVTTARLVKEFDVSIETIRRDFLLMEKDGMLTRVHGGAVSMGEMGHFFDLTQRNQEFSEQKKELANIASKYVNDGDYIAIDAGSTAISFAQVLKEQGKKVTVVTHSYDIFEILESSLDFSVILCGGEYIRGENAFAGNLALEVLDKLHLQKAFIFPAAISLEFGICDYQQELMMIQKKLIKISEKIYILADSSKFERKALYKLSEMNSEYTYITDSNLPVELKTLYFENGIDIINGGL